MTTIADEFFRAEPQAIALLAASDPPTWERLINPISPLSPSDACPLVLLRALLAIDDPNGWRGRCDRAYSGRAPWNSGAGHFILRPWLARGIIQHLPPTDLAALHFRYEALLHDVFDDATKLARELTINVENAGNSPETLPLLGNARLLLAHRLGEDRDHEGAIAAAQRAEEVFTRLGDETSRVRAVRMRGAALFRLRRVDEALAALDTVTDAPYVYGLPVEGRSTASSSPADAVFFAAAAQAERSTDSREWFTELGRIAAHLDHHACAERARVGIGQVREREARQEAAAKESAEAQRAAKAKAAAAAEARRVAEERAAMRAHDGSIVENIRVTEEGGQRVWTWDVREAFNPRYDAWTSAEGLSYACEIQGPFCGYDGAGSQTWDEFLAAGPPAHIRMPLSVEADIRAYALARKPAESP